MHLGIDRRCLDAAATRPGRSRVAGRARRRAGRAARSCRGLRCAMLSAIEWSPIRQSRRSCAIRPSPECDRPVRSVDRRVSTPSTKIGPVALALSRRRRSPAPPRCSRRRAGRTVRQSRLCSRSRSRLVTRELGHRLSSTARSLTSSALLGLFAGELRELGVSAFVADHLGDDRLFAIRRWCDADRGCGRRA